MGGKLDSVGCIVPSTPPLRGSSGDDLARLRRVREALVFAAMNCTTNERPLYASIRRSLMTLDARLLSAAQHPRPADGPLPWEQPSFQTVSSASVPA